MAILLLSGIALCATEKRNYEIWGTKGEDTVIMPHVAPLIGVIQVSGPKMPEHGSINCDFKTDIMKSPGGDTIHILAGYCENGVVVHVTSIDLNH